MLKKAIITEKSMLSAGNGVFTFAVDLLATKTQVKSLVEATFRVHVTKVTIVHKKGKAVRTGKRRLPAMSPSQKYARVFLKKGETITLFDIKKD